MGEVARFPEQPDPKTVPAYSSDGFVHNLRHEDRVTAASQDLTLQMYVELQTGDVAVPQKDIKKEILRTRPREHIANLLHHRHGIGKQLAYKLISSRLDEPDEPGAD